MATGRGLGRLGALSLLCPIVLLQQPGLFGDLGEAVAKGMLQKFSVRGR